MFLRKMMRKIAFMCKMMRKMKNRHLKEKQIGTAQDIRMSCSGTKYLLPVELKDFFLELYISQLPLVP